MACLFKSLYNKPFKLKFYDLIIILLAQSLRPQRSPLQAMPFKNGETIPIKYTCEGKNQNPSLIIDGIPDKTKSLTVIMVDPDVPAGTFVHWIYSNVIPRSTPSYLS